MGQGRQVKRLFDLEIDEVSLVDRPANQFGKVAFSKRAEEDMPELYDVDGNEVDESEIEHGETVFDESGNEFVYLQEGTPEFDELAAEVDSAYDDYDEEDELDGADDDERELAAVGKSRFGNLRGAASEYRAAGGFGARAGRAARNAPGRAGRNVSRMGRTVNTPANRRTAAVAGGASSVGYVGGRRGRSNVGKGLGRTVYEDLSKALRQSDRDEAIAKAFDVIDEQAERIEQLTGFVGKMADDRAIEEFSKLAEEYGPLPVRPDRLGLILKRASETLPAEDVQILDRLFTSVGEQLYAEVGKGGTGASVGVMEQVDALANEMVGKSDVSREQAITDIFATNPEAYDEYLADNPAQVR